MIVKILKESEMLHKMWNEDVVKLLNALVEFKVDSKMLRPVVKFCVNVSKERNISLNEVHNERMKEALEKLNFDEEGNEKIAEELGERKIYNDGMFANL